MCVFVGGWGGKLGEWRKEVFFQILPKSRSVFFISALMRFSHPKQSPKCRSILSDGSKFLAHLSRRLRGSL